MLQPEETLLFPLRTLRQFKLVQNKIDREPAFRQRLVKTNKWKSITVKINFFFQVTSMAHSAGNTLFKAINNMMKDHICVTLARKFTYHGVQPTHLKEKKFCFSRHAICKVMEGKIVTLQANWS